ncbi:hypothetical protein AAVH_37365, partial [Aphelenchoides avenae]
LHDIRRIFALKHGHDGALLMHLFDQRTGEFSPLVHSRQNTIPVDPKTVPQWLKEQHGLRHQSGYCMSMLTDAIVLVVSEEYGRLCIFLRGGMAPVVTTGITTDNFINELRSAILNAMRKERAEYDCLYGSITLAEHYISNALRGFDVHWQAPGGQGNVGLLRNSAKYLTHEGVLEIPDGGLSEMELQKREQFLQKFHILAYDAMDDYGASVWVGHEDNSQLYLVQDLTGRLPSISADELKELVASALEQACKFHMTEDLDVGKLEESHASLSS